MELSQQNAMSIVAEISDIIGQHVNMMDDRGVIVASTDPQRIGTFHEGAATLLEKRMDKLIVDYDAQFKGSRKGINLPLMLNDRPVGVIGVTGEYREVMKYGQIIKKMTEAVMRENYRKDQKKIDDRIQTRFLDEWVLDGAPVTPELVERGARLDIDVLQNYRVVVAVIADLRRYSDTADGQMMIDRINRRVRRMAEGIPGGVFAKTATRMICLLPRSSAAGDDPAAFAQEALRIVERELDVRLYAGIDGGAEGVHQAYQQASKAVQACAAGSQSVCAYEDIGLEIFMDEIPQSARQAYVQRVFRGCTDKEIEQLVAILQVYFENNGSIGRTAERLFLHKNTLQYRLKKMYEKTGYDPRNIADSALVYLAMQFYLAAKR